MTEREAVAVLINRGRVFPKDIANVYDQLMAGVATYDGLLRAWGAISHGALWGAAVDVSHVTCSEKSKASMLEAAEGLPI